MMEPMEAKRDLDRRSAEGAKTIVEERGLDMEALWWHHANLR